MEKLKMFTDTIASTIQFLAEAAKGLVRPLITVGLVTVFCIEILKGKITAEVYVPIVMTVLTFWFTQRDKEKPENGNGKINEIKKS